MDRITGKGFVSFFSLLLMATLVSTQTCPNNIAVYNPNIKTACVNGTFFIIPVSTTTVQAAVKPYKLVPLPTSDKTLFPNGFPAGTVPVLVTIDIQNDIRGGPLQMPTSLLGGSVQVPYVDRLGDGKTPFLFTVKQYIGGYNGNDISGILPAIVSTLAGITIYQATFVPNNAPYQQFSTPPPEYIAQVKKVIVPNPVSGPAVIEEAIDTDFFTTSTPTYTAHTFHELISQPLIGNDGFCLREPIYFNQTFTNPIFRTGTVTLYSTGTVTLYSPGAAFPGVYSGVQGYSASGENIGYSAEPCASAAAKTDPKALA